MATLVGTRASPRRQPALATGLLGVVAAAGIALRVWVYRSGLGVPNSDEAVVGLMARHILHGQIPTFFWGQAYGGSQEALLTAPLFLVAGSSWLALRLVPIVLSALAALLVWRVGRRVLGEPRASVAAALFWLWPPFLVYQLTHQQGFYGSDVVYCALLLLLGLRVVERPSRLRVGLFGLVFGLAFWETAQIVPLAAGLVVWVLLRRPESLRSLWLALPLAALGALPWILWNARHGFASLNPPTGGSSSYPHRFHVFFSPVMPMLAGLRAPFSQQWLLPAALTVLLYGLAAALFLVGAFRSRRRPPLVLYLVTALFPFVWALDAETAVALDPRYAVVLTPVLVLLVAQLARGWRSAVLLLALAAAVSVVTLRRMENVPPPQPMAPRVLGPLVATLDRLHLRDVYADYWVAYVLDFDTRERIVAVESRFDAVRFRSGRALLPPDPVVRYPPYQRAVAAARHGFVLFRAELGAYPILPALEAHGYRATSVGPFLVLSPPG